MSGSFTDAYGRAITQETDGSWTTSGMAIGPCPQPQAQATFAGMAPPDSIPTIVPTTIDPLSFMARLTPAEQAAIAAAAQSNATVLLFLLKLSGAQTVTVTDPLTIAGTQEMVTAGLLTAARATQILDLTQVSP